MESEQNRFLLPQHAPAPRRKRWGGCLLKLSCFRKQKGGGKRIVPATRIPETNSNNQNPQNGPHQPLPQPTGLPPSLYAPPSSPASFSHSAVPSTVQSPTCFLSANSPPPGPTMFVTGPYAHETQLVSPPVFSTFTTEPSTAPLTPPPELAHLTTPSSPDVPYAHFLSSSRRSSDKAGYNINDLQATYSLYPGSPASALRSPVSRTPQWSGPSPEPASDSGRARQDSNFFCPETFAQFYLDQSSFSNGRLSISREADGYSNGQGQGHCQNGNRQGKICKADAEELEAYRASFGFSADEIITTAHYVEISEGLEEPFSIAPVGNSKSDVEEQRRVDFPSPQLRKAGIQDQAPQKQAGDVSARTFQSTHILSDDEDIFAKMGASRLARKHHFGSSNSDAEIEYRRGRSLRERSRRES